MGAKPAAIMAGMRPPFFLPLLSLVGTMLVAAPAAAENQSPPTAETTKATASAQAIFGSRKGGFVFTDCRTGETTRIHPAITGQPFPPCSTFKIWNTAIGLEEGILTRPDEPFYKWDGVKRFMEAWNHDLTLREAYQASCVPAFQQLARRIGEPAMKRWIARLGYGDGNTAAGLDVFWLPEVGRKPILISAQEQTALLRRLVSGELPFSEHTRTVLREVMEITKSKRGTLYGKTGTGQAGGQSISWFVGYLQSGEKAWAFAAVLQEPGMTGRDTRLLVEEFLHKEGLL